MRASRRGHDADVILARGSQYSTRPASASHTFSKHLKSGRTRGDERTAILPRSLAQQLVRISTGGSSADSGTAGGGRDQARACRTWTDGHYGPRRSRQMAAIRGGPLGSHFGLFAAAARRGGFLCMESGYDLCLCTVRARRGGWRHGECKTAIALLGN